MHNVPKQVREQAEESDRLIAEANKDLTAEPSKKEKPAEQANKIDPENYKERYVNFKKATDATISTLRGDVSQLTGQVEVLTNQNAEFIKQLQAKPEEKPSNQKPIDTSVNIRDRILNVLSDDEKESYSPEFLDMLGRVNQVVQSGETNHKDDLNSRLENIEKTQHQTAEDIFWGDINKSVPSWREVQSSDQFQAYLNEYDPLLGTTRLTVLKQAQSDLNSERAIAVFTTHINGLQNLDVDEGNPTNPLDKHVVPDMTGAGDGSDIEVLPNLTEADIQQFYTDVALGRYATRQSEMASMEDAIRKINAAYKQSPTNVENKSTY